MCSESILPKTPQPAGRATWASFHLLLHLSSLLESEFVEGVVPGHEEVTHGSSRAQEESREQQIMLLWDITSPDLRLCGAHIQVVQEQVDAVPWLCSSPSERATASRLFETSFISPQLLFVKRDH